jgi:hypothetical protein
MFKRALNLQILNSEQSNLTDAKFSLQERVDYGFDRL